MHARTDRTRLIRLAAWGGGITLILLPLWVWKAIDPDAWDIADLPFALILVFAVGAAFELALRVPPRWTRGAGVTAAVGTGLLLIFGNLAVGFAGSEDNSINSIFFLVPTVALLGSIAARFQPKGIAVALEAAGAGQLAAGVAALIAGYFTAPLTVAFTGFWLASALLFRRSAEGILRNGT